MSFQNVDMDPIEKAFQEWQAAKEAAKHAREFAERAVTHYRPHITVNIQIVNVRDGTSTINHHKGAEALSHWISRQYQDDPREIVAAAVMAMDADAEEKRAAFLRATLGGLAGD